MIHLVFDYSESLQKAVDVECFGEDFMFTVEIVDYLSLIHI